MLGLSWAEAHHEAGKWEHVISPPVEAALIGCSTTRPRAPRQPHPRVGLPTPQRHGRAGRRSDIGTKFTVQRIPEELEFRPGLLEFLEGAAIVPGRSGQVTAMSPDGTTTVAIDGNHVGVGSFASERILVTVA